MIFDLRHKYVGSKNQACAKWFREKVFHHLHMIATSTIFEKQVLNARTRIRFYHDISKTCSNITTYT